MVMLIISGTYMKAHVTVDFNLRAIGNKNKPLIGFNAALSSTIQ